MWSGDKADPDESQLARSKAEVSAAKLSLHVTNRHCH